MHVLVSMPQITAYCCKEHVHCAQQHCADKQATKDKHEVDIQQELKLPPVERAFLGVQILLPTCMAGAMQYCRSS